MSNEQALKLRINGKEYEVVVGDLTHDPVRVQVNGQSFLVELSPTRPTETRAAPVDASRSVRREEPGESMAAAEAPPATSAPTDAAVLAPMPGSIMKIRVKPGQRVEVGDVLCYLEAMKMHNPIHAPSAGVIEEVAVTEGQAVVYRQVLVKYAV